MTDIEVLERANDYVGIHYVNGVEDAYISPCLLKAIKNGIAALREQEERENQKPLSAFIAPMDSYKGLKRKFLVFKSDTGEMIENCFVLRPGKDPAAVAALLAYAEATDNETLSADIINWVGAERNDPLTLDELRQMDGEPVYIVCPGYEHEFPGRWEILERAGSWGWNGIHAEYFESSYESEWLAYRSKPKEDD